MRSMRKKYSAAFKAKVAIEAIKGVLTQNIPAILQPNIASDDVMS
jgi:hypothetical protein